MSTIETSIKAAQYKRQQQLAALAPLRPFLALPYQIIAAMTGLTWKKEEKPAPQPR